MVTICDRAQLAPGLDNSIMRIEIGITNWLSESKKVNVGVNYFNICSKKGNMRLESILYFECSTYASLLVSLVVESSLLKQGPAGSSATIVLMVPYRTCFPVKPATCPPTNIFSEFCT